MLPPFKEQLSLPGVGNAWDAWKYQRLGSSRVPVWMFGWMTWKKIGTWSFQFHQGGVTSITWRLAPQTLTPFLNDIFGEVISMVSRWSRYGATLSCCRVGPRDLPAKCCWMWPLATMMVMKTSTSCDLSWWRLGFECKVYHVSWGLLFFGA